MENESITSFSGEYRWLSNFWLSDISILGLTFPSAENAYQSFKLKDRKDAHNFVDLTPGQAKRLGSMIDIRPDWDIVKISAMSLVVSLKFDDEELKKKLLDTGNRVLIEGNTWGDTYWGQCPLGVGKNKLGKLLMKQRDIIRKHWT